jgi:coenzyme F420-0:L-glutamate ligase/coenzyme F420-1:gamma-L-glutamate ligase
MQDESKLGSFIARRRSVRRYRSEPIGHGAIERLLHAATQAPSAHNRQPWRFVVLQNAAVQDALASAMGERLRRDRSADGDDAQSIDKDVARSRERLTQAPCVVVICVDTRDIDPYPDARRATAEHMMAVQSAAMAAQNLLLAAERDGLGACVMCAPVFCPDVVVRTLNLPPDWQPQMLVTLGVPAAPGRERPRRPLAEIVLWRAAGNQLAR